jgi:hypothetical protein
MVIFLLSGIAGGQEGFWRTDGFCGIIFMKKRIMKYFFTERMIIRDVLLTTVNKYLKILTNEERCGLKVVAVDRSQ